MSDIRSTELNKLKITALKVDEIIPRQQWEKEKEAYEIDIKNLKETKAHLENQLKFQAQVNSELKTLLGRKILTMYVCSFLKITSFSCCCG